jgi:phospholipid-binding lipoprotein MlaA
VQAVDEAFVAPIAYGYQKGLPEPIRDGIHNALNNLDEPIVLLNFLLQLKIGKAVETVGRFTINSTVGVAGLFDVAEKKPFKLPRRSNGLADTLGYYGVGSGPYLFLPLIGSTTLRDVVGRIADLSLLPATAGKPFTNPLVSVSKGVLSSIDDRVENDEILTRIQQSGNPYAAMREYYLRRRQAEIDVLRGKRCNADINLADLEFMDSLPETKKPSKKSPASPKN